MAGDLVDDLLDRLSGARFDVESQQRLGVGHPQVEPGAVAEVDGHAVEVVDRVHAGAVGLQHGLHDGRGVGDGEVDLAGGFVALVVGHQVRQRAVLFAERGQHVQRGQHPGVGTPEVAEVVVRGVLAAEDRSGLGHQPLDVGMPDPGPQRCAAALDDQLGHRARGDEVVDDGRADFALQFPRGDQRGHRRRRHRLAHLVDDEAPVGVTVEGQADVGAGLQDVGLQVDEVGGVQRVGFVVGERAVEFEEQRRQRDRRDRAEHRGRGVARHAVSGVDGDLQVRCPPMSTRERRKSP